MRGWRGAGAALAGLAVLASLLGAWSTASVPAVPQAVETPPLGLDLYYAVPADNPVTPEKAALGRRLFFDEALSRDSSVACASCHRPESAFADGTPRSMGVGGVRTERNTPSVVNVGYRRTLFWDGRVSSLEEAVLMPVEHPREMRLPVEEAVFRLEADDGHRKGFEALFENGVSRRALARALATYLRTLRSGGSPLDRFFAGDTSALDPLARSGLKIFRGRGNCVACHSGPLLSDERFHNTGVSGGADAGRSAVTGDPSDLGRFRTPSLRNVALTPPYMHDGSLSSLEEVVTFYERGGGSNRRLDPEMEAIDLGPADRRPLVAFFHALTGTGAGGGGGEP